MKTIGLIGGIGAAVFWAVYTIATKKSLENGMHTYTILFYSIILLSIALIPFTSFNQITAFVNADILSNTAFLILHSTFSFAMPYILLTVSLNRVD